MEDTIRKTVVRNVAEESCFTVNELDLVYRVFKVSAITLDVIDDSPYYVFVALCIVVIVVSLIFKMAYFCPDPCNNFKKKLGSGAR
jgi:hypothetical protein